MLYNEDQIRTAFIEYMIYENETGEYAAGLMYQIFKKRFLDTQIIDEEEGEE